MSESTGPHSGAKADAPSVRASAGRRQPKRSGRVAKKTGSLDLLYQIATILGQPGSLEQLLGGFLDALVERLEARAASVRLATADGLTRLIASRGLAPDVVEADRLMPFGTCPCGWASSEGGLRTQSGTGNCARLIGRPMLEHDCTEFVVVPVHYQDRILGVYNLFLDRPLVAMGEDLPDLLLSAGRHLGLAIEKARLDGEAHRLAIMEERNIIGNELHDSLAQSLIGMRLQLKMLSEALARKDIAAAQGEAKALGRALTQANGDLRNLLTNYRLKIDEAGLEQMLTKMISRFRGETGIAVFFQNDCETLAPLALAQEIQVFYIIQEALTNIRKHSEAHNVRILLNNEGDLYTVLIEDDGLGMAGTDEPISGEHAGLAIMRERTQRLPGQFVIESEPGEGTRIVLIFNAPPPADVPKA